jgi:hypothetical protein
LGMATLLKPNMLVLLQLLTAIYVGCRRTETGSRSRLGKKPDSAVHALGITQGRA